MDVGGVSFLTGRRDLPPMMDPYPDVQERQVEAAMNVTERPPMAPREMRCDTLLPPIPFHFEWMRKNI